MRRDAVYLIDIIEAAKLVMSYVTEKSKEDFLADSQCQDAVIRRLEIIGEAARRISEEIRIQHASIPWKSMMGMRNLMIHEYDGVDLSVVWETVQKDLPVLMAKVEKILAAIGGK